MLYNPNWTKADPLTLEAFAVWLEAKPANERYNYFLSDKCAWAQFSGKSEELLFWERPDINSVVANLPWTFGAALSRARAMLAKQS